MQIETLPIVACALLDSEGWWLCYCNTVKLSGRTVLGKANEVTVVPFAMRQDRERCDGCGRPRGKEPERKGAFVRRVVVEEGDY